MIKTVFSDKNYCLFHLSAFLSVCSPFYSESVFSMLYMSVVCQFFFFWCTVFFYRRTDHSCICCYVRTLGITRK